MSDYDLGEGTVPTAVYNDLAEFTYGAAYTESATFPISLKERVAAGNFDLYAMDTWRPTARATFTIGLRATWNTNPVNQQHLFARPAGSFLDLSHSVSQPLDQAIQTTVRGLFPATPLLAWQPRASMAYQVARGTVVHVGFGVFNDIIPAQIADLAATNAPYAPTFVGGLGGQVGGVAIAPGVPNSAADAASSANRRFQLAFAAGAAPCAGIAAGAPTCPLALSLNTFSTGTLKTPYYYQYNLGIERQIGANGAVRVDYVGTRGLHEPFQVGLNGYETVCAGCFTPYPYEQPLDQRFGSVNEFRTDASSTYSGLQASVSERFHSLTLRGNYTLSHCLDEVSNGGLLSFSSQGILSPLPGELSRNYGNCDYDVRQNVSAFGIYQIPFSFLPCLVACAFSQLVVFRDGIPSYRSPVQRTQPAVHGQRQRRLSGQWAAVCAPRTRSAALPQNSVFRRDRCGNPTMAESRCICLDCQSQHGRVHRRRLPRKLPVRQTWAAMRCADRTLRTPTSISRANFRSGNMLRFASTCKCSMPSTIRTSHCPAAWKLAFPASIFRRSSARLKAQSRHLLGYSAWASVEIARRE